MKASMCPRSNAARIRRVLGAALVSTFLATGCMDMAGDDDVTAGAPGELAAEAIDTTAAAIADGILPPGELSSDWQNAAPASVREHDAGSKDEHSLVITIPSKYSAIFRQDSNHRTAINQDWATFSSTWQQNSSQGYRLMDIDTTIEGGVRRYSGVFEPGSGGYYLWVGVSWTSFVNKWSELAGQGLRLVDLETYMENGSRVYTGVWRPGNDGHYLWVGVDWTSFVNKWSELAPLGLRLIDIEVWQDGSSLRYAGVWRQGSGGYALWVGASWNNFAKKWMELGQQGLRLVDMEAYTFNGSRLYAGVFRAGSGSYDLIGATSKTVLEHKIASLAGEGKQPVAIEYESGSDMPPPGMAAAFSDVIDGHAVGYSFAVAENGQITSAGGFGHARGTWEAVNPGVAMTGYKRSHLASVSKPITAVALMNLIEAGNTSLDTPFVNIIGYKFASIGAGVSNVTLRNLLQHRSGMAAWGDCGPNLQTSMSSLVSLPLAGMIGQYQYSNGNFCLLRMVVEELSGQSYVTYVRNSVLAPMGITGMTCTPDTSSPTLYYKYNVFNQAGAFWSNDYSGECGAYGWYGSAADLARFLIGVRNNTVLSATTASTMMTQGLGWFAASTVNGTGRWHNGAWYTGDRRGYNGAIAQLPGGVEAVVLINTNGYLGNGTNYFDTIGTLVDGYNRMQSY